MTHTPIRVNPVHNDRNHGYQANELFSAARAALIGEGLSAEPRLAELVAIVAHGYALAILGKPLSHDEPRCSAEGPRLIRIGQPGELGPEFNEELDPEGWEVLQATTRSYGPLGSAGIMQVMRSQGPWRGGGTAASEEIRAHYLQVMGARSAE